MPPLSSRVAAVALVAATLALGACGSGNSDPTTSAQGTGAKAAAGLEFAQCMRSHGVTNFPDPGSNGHGGIQIQASQRAGSGASMSVNGVSVSAPVFQSAMQECRHYLPNGGIPSAAQTAHLRAAALAMSRCMRSHGVPDFPDPVFSTGPGGGFGIRLGGPGVDKNSPAFQAAQKICQPLLGGPVKLQPGTP